MKTGVDGEYATKRSPVLKRMGRPGDELHGMARAGAKEAAYEELCRWRDTVASESRDGAAAAGAAVIHRSV